MTTHHAARRRTLLGGLVSIAAACSPSGAPDATPDATSAATPSATVPAEQAAAPEADEPEVGVDGDTTTWTFDAPDGAYTVRQRGFAGFSDDDRTLRWLRPGGELLVERSNGAGTTSIRAVSGDDGRPNLSGRIAGASGEAGVPALVAALAELLPTAIAYPGLAASRLEDSVDNGQLEQALAEIARWPTSTARLAGYRSLIGQVDDAEGPEVIRTLHHAARHLTGDWFMHELLLEDIEVDFGNPQLMAAFLEAAGSIQSDDLHGDVLCTHLDLNDEQQPDVVAAILHSATISIRSEAERVLVLKAMNWTTLRSAAGWKAYAEALAALQEDGLLRDVLAELFAGGSDLPAEQLVLGLDVAQHQIESADLRCSALAALPPEALRLPAVRERWEQVAAGVAAPDALADMLAQMLQARPGGRLAIEPAAVASVLRVLQAALPRDARASRVLRAVPDATLADPEVAQLYRAAVETLPSPQDRSELRKRLDGPPRAR